ncbi:two-component system cell cycle sensor histidine kinase/response regulator CckA [Sulfitobacter undariae]|uniref:histidine kinase n=1 Tax=Sulfitobacter undariae TaxID=1563671 RepID=A0A7W6E6T8_9RHOB|nr:ATP-binding protein [Sulfitobacter undariae]MBB3995812.1 two-component system cell cycle sensor histidine kinase/response regulator CckA [Sulfitobacter undariae]
MRHIIDSGSSPRLATITVKRLLLLAALAVVNGVVAGLLPAGHIRHIVMAAGISFLCVFFAVILLKLWFSFRREQSHDAVGLCIQNDWAPSFVTTSSGEIKFTNLSAQQHFGERNGTGISTVLEGHIGNGQSVFARMQSRAVLHGAAREMITTQRGQILVSVHTIEVDGFVWRVEPPELHADDDSFANAPILPMIMVGQGGAILSMNHTAKAFIGRSSETLHSILGDQEVATGSVVQVGTSKGIKPALAAQMDAGAGRIALYLLPSPADDGGLRYSNWKVFQDLPIPMIKIAPDGCVQSFNRRAQALIGVVLEEGAYLPTMMEGLGRSISDWLADTVDGRLGQKSEFLRLTRGDREIFVQVTLSRFVQDGVPALIAVLHDATELKSLEAQFVQSQKMQAIGQLAGGVAHDFNNLLTAISGHCDLLLLRHDPGDIEYSDLVQINQNANRAAALVGQLLAFSRKQTLRPEILDMRDTLADLTHLLNRLVGEKVTLTLRSDPALHPIRADKRQLEQVLMNLVVNARDAMPTGGEIRIITETERLLEPLSRDQVIVPTGEYITIRVKDSGLGIAPDKLPKIFEPFFTTKRIGEGTGLGLSTAYGIIKQTGGYIFVDSKEGKGSCFTLYLPAYVQSKEVEKSGQPEADTKAGNTPNGGVILLVEDEAPVRAFASRALRLKGYTVLEAENAEVALATLEDRDLKVDMFVTDVVMPGMDGPSWVREALKTRPEVSVIFVSGYAEDSLGEAQKQIPNSAFLPKPFSLSDLTEAVNKLLG